MHVTIHLILILIPARPYNTVSLASPSRLPIAPATKCTYLDPNVHFALTRLAASAPSLADPHPHPPRPQPKLKSGRQPIGCLLATSARYCVCESSNSRNYARVCRHSAQLLGLDGGRLGAPKAAVVSRVCPQLGLGRT
ncbi:hypothetical protein EDC01DRAFT_509231 [Geopyxis carbonaria]|nr:hypothetical protein EDC01DRAFT_509231 [Geopyxis carbonaria]